MEMLLFRPLDYQNLYDCSIIRIELVPLESRLHIIKAVITIVLCAIYYILYIPCIISIYKRMNNACYRLLFHMSIADCCILWMLGFLHGYLSLTGAVYCSHPKFIYVIGCLMSGLWIVESTTEVALVMNRCLAILAPRTEATLFGGKRILIYIAISLVYGTWWCFYVKPCLFNGMYFTWFLNPYVGYDVDENAALYESVIHAAWDTSIALGIPILYILFILTFLIKRKALDGRSTVSHKQKMMLIQVFITSVLNFVACSIYAYMNYVIPGEWLIYFAQFCWFNIHGMPPVIFLCLNKSIRNDTKRMINYVLAKQGVDAARMFVVSSKMESVKAVSVKQTKI